MPCLPIPFLFLGFNSFFLFLVVIGDKFVGYINEVCIFIVCGHVQHESNGLAVLESTGSKGSVLINGIAVKKNDSRVLHSGDEVVFDTLGSYAFVCDPKFFYIV